MRRILVVLLMLLAAPATATAMTDAQAIDVAETYWGPHACTGQVVVQPEPGLLNATGYLGHAARAITMNPDGTWQRTSCTIVIDADLRDSRCQTIVHEVGHLIHGPGHTGPMANIDPPACRIPLRTQLVRHVRAELPGPGWKVWCTPTAWRMTCRAHRPANRLRTCPVRLYSLRRYDAIVFPCRTNRRPT